MHRRSARPRHAPGHGRPSSPSPGSPVRRFPPCRRRRRDPRHARPSATSASSRRRPMLTVPVSVRADAARPATMSIRASRDARPCRSAPRRPAGSTDVIDMVPATIGPVAGGLAGRRLGCPSPAPTLTSTVGQVTLRHAAGDPGVGYVYDILLARTVARAATTTRTPLARRDPAVAVHPRCRGQHAAGPDRAGRPDRRRRHDRRLDGRLRRRRRRTDAEDDPDPSPSARPAAGEVLPLGTTTVACSVTDAGGLLGHGLVRVTVVDTTAPIDRGRRRPSRSPRTTRPAPGPGLSTRRSSTDIVDADADGRLQPAGRHDLPGRDDDRDLHGHRRQRQRARATAFDVTVDLHPGHTARRHVGGAGRRRRRRHVRRQPRSDRAGQGHPRSRRRRPHGPATRRSPSRPAAAGRASSCRSPSVAGAGTRAIDTSDLVGLVPHRHRRDRWPRRAGLPARAPRGEAAKADDGHGHGKRRRSGPAGGCVRSHR